MKKAVIAVLNHQFVESELLLIEDRHFIRCVGGGAVIQYLIDTEFLIQQIQKVAK